MLGTSTRQQYAAKTASGEFYSAARPFVCRIDWPCPVPSSVHAKLGQRRSNRRVLRTATTRVGIHAQFARSAVNIAPAKLTARTA
jgi:hypothetical protein